MNLQKPIFKLVTLLLVLFLVLPAQISASDNSNQLGCRTVFKDKFSGANLKSGWTYVDPNNDVALSLRDRRGFLRLSTDAPFGNDLYINSTNGARLLRDLDTAEFVIETNVTFQPQGDYHGGGIFIWQDASNFIRFERGLGINGTGVYFAVNDNNNFNYTYVATNASTITLKLVRTGSAFDGYMREPEGAWKRVGSFDVPFATTLQVGLHLVAEHGVPPTVIDYDYYVISTCNTAMTGSESEN